MCRSAPASSSLPPPLRHPTHTIHTSPFPPTIPPTPHTSQAEAYQQQGAKAFQVPLTAKPRLYDALLESSRTLPRTPFIKESRLQGRGVELVVLEEEEEVMKTLFEISDGSPRYGHGSYDPVERIWRWLPAEMGPHEQVEGMKEGVRELVKEEEGAVLYVVSKRGKGGRGGSERGELQWVHLCPCPWRLGSGRANQPLNDSANPPPAQLRPSIQNFSTNVSPLPPLPSLLPCSVTYPPATSSAWPVSSTTLPCTYEPRLGTYG